MKVTGTTLPDVLVIEPQVFGDSRGFFLESFNQRNFNAATGADVGFVQDNHSRSAHHVLRGLHYQVEKPQGKLVRVLQGVIFDVVVDLRRSSPAFGRWLGMTLDARHHQQLWVPAGFAHGFLVLSDGADVAYKTTGYYEPALERCVVWNDPALRIEWPLVETPTLSGKDRAGKPFADAEYF